MQYAVTSENGCWSLTHKHLTLEATEAALERGGLVCTLSALREGLVLHRDRVSLTNDQRRRQFVNKLSGKGVKVPEARLLALEQAIRASLAPPVPAVAEPEGDAPTGPDKEFVVLEEGPLALRRPLALVDGQAYAATWLWTQRTVRAEFTAEFTKEGEYVRYDPPQVRTERVRFIIREDGTVFQDSPHGVPANLETRSEKELGLHVLLPTRPREEQLWSMRGVRAYGQGRRAVPPKVFAVLVKLIDRFVAFDRSLADQRTMCEFVACYVLATWFLDAFTSFPYLYPNGPSGSGKTQLGVLICQVAYLGEVLTSGSTHASVRDLADLGATLLFDDAEDLFDPKKGDPDKRNLLLAGNRKGAMVTVKELGPDRSWSTRYVDAYCPRLCTAIRLPDAVLGSRTIVVPVVRTADTGRANRDPLDYDAWTTDRARLLDALWSLGLAHLAEMGEHQAAVNQDAPLQGRALEPWRPILAVAHWLNQLGEAGLYARLTQLAQAYQTERAELEFGDHTRVVVRALLAAALRAVPFDPSRPRPHRERGFTVQVDAVTQEANRIAKDEDLPETDGSFTSSKRVGKALTQLRVKQATRSGHAPRSRRVTPQLIQDLAVAYAVPGIPGWEEDDPGEEDA